VVDNAIFYLLILRFVPEIFVFRSQNLKLDVFALPNFWDPFHILGAGFPKFVWKLSCPSYATSCGKLWWDYSS